MIGTSISRYNILEELGQGGMSTVYLARDTGLGRQVAVKVLHDHLAKKPDNRKRFRREAEAIARLQHPNIVDVYDVSGEAEDRSFIVMEYVAGMNLRQFIDHHGPPPAEVAAMLGTPICTALTHAHKHGVIHRDLKPENVMISAAGEVKLMDFGIAHVIDAETMTKTGSLLGSPAHMAPELIDGQRIDQRADVFAMGTVLYWMSTATLPFSGNNTPQVLRNVMEGRYAEVETVSATISHDLSRIIAKSLNTDPEDRFGSVAALSRDLLASVHAVGIDDAQALLDDYLADPAAFVQAFDADIVDRLIVCGKRAMDRGNIPGAIAYFNRALAYEPQNERVQACLDQLGRRRRRWRVAGGAAVVVAAAVLGIWGYWSTSEPGPGSAVGASKSRVTRAVVVGRQAAARRAARRQSQAVVGRARTEGARQTSDLTANERATAVAEAVAAHGRRLAEAVAARLAVARTPTNTTAVEQASGAKAPGPDVGVGRPTDAGPTEDAGADAAANRPAQTVAVAFKVLPQSARLEIDGRQVTWQLGPVELTRGRHQIKATAPKCLPYRDSLLVNEPRHDKVPVVLQWKNAAIAVDANRNALVYVGDESNPRANARHAVIEVPFRAGMRDPKKTVKLRVNDSQNLRRVERREVVVRPGQSQAVKVNFP